MAPTKSFKIRLSSKIPVEAMLREQGFQRNQMLGLNTYSHMPSNGIIWLQVIVIKMLAFFIQRGVSGEESGLEKKAIGQNYPPLATEMRGGLSFIS